MKDNDTVIREFNELVNMTPQELEQWLKSDDSRSAGWPKDGEGGDADGESVGHDSGRKIVDILESNPDRAPDKYTDAQLQHMRKVVSYCKRHLAQEEKSNDEKPAEEVEKTKSYASLKNWGHDVLKKRAAASGSGPNGDKGEGDKQAGDKRKAPADGEDGDDDDAANKRRETEQGGSADGDKARHRDSNGHGAHDKEGASGANGANGSGSGPGSGQNGNESETGRKEANGSSNGNGPEIGATVSWDWGNGQPEGKVLDVKEEKTTITTKRGNEVSRDGNPEDPAVVLDTGKSKAVKSAHELNE